LLVQVLEDNRAITIVPLDHELTPNQAAELLHVSRGTINGLIDRKAFPARMVGTHRRIQLGDLLAYKVKADAAHDTGMRDLVALEQALGLD
jgi:excisionase family DNA binding protein